MGIINHKYAVFEFNPSFHFISFHFAEPFRNSQSRILAGNLKKRTLYRLVKTFT